MECINEMSRYKLLWIDMEMTGLSAESDAILEIAVVASDECMECFVEGPHLVIHQPAEVLDRMGQWCYEQHTATGLLDEVAVSSINVSRATQLVRSFVIDFCEEKPLLCGNTIYQDRLFLKAYMPQVDELLHYRQIDVSSVKELVKAWYPDKPVTFAKQKRHRALDDIYESMNELRYYRKHFFI